MAKEERRKDAAVRENKRRMNNRKGILRKRKEGQLSLSHI